MDRKGCIKGKSCGATCIDASERCVLELGPIVNNSVNQVRSKLESAPAPKKSEDAGALFMKQLGGGEKPQSVPPELKNQLAALGAPPKETSTLKTSDMFDDISRILRGESPRHLEVASAGGETGARVREKPTEVRRLEKELRSVLGSRADSSMNLDQLREAAASMANDMSGTLPGTGKTAAHERKLRRIDELIADVDALSASATGNTRWARVEAKDFDDALGKVRREGNASYNGWGDSYGSGATKIGEGAYGTVIRNKDGTFVKRGDISDTEAELIGRLGKMDLGPKLVAADINGPAQYHTEKSVDMRNGRIAMGQVPGEPIGKMASAGTQIGGKNAADIYWKAMADLHRAGIAHNDAHIDNILVDDKGKGRWVDLGLAQASPKAALAEAMGIFKPLKGGDTISIPSGATGEGNWQTVRWNAVGASTAERLKREGKWAEFQERFPVAAKVWDNQEKVIKKMENMGMDVNEINSVITHGIRSSPESYNRSDGFSRMSDEQAQDLIKTLYDGI